MPNNIEPAIRELAEIVIAGGGSKRAADVLRVMLDKGSISTDEINALGYNQLMPDQSLSRTEINDVGKTLAQAFMLRSGHTIEVTGARPKRYSLKR